MRRAYADRAMKLLRTSARVRRRTLPLAMFRLPAKLQCASIRAATSTGRTTPLNSASPAIEYRRRGAREEGAMKFQRKEKRLARATRPHQKTARIRPHTPPLTMFRDLRALVQSILADTWIGPIRQRGDASLVMTQCVLPSHQTRKNSRQTSTSSSRARSKVTLMPRHFQGEPCRCRWRRDPYFNGGRSNRRVSTDARSPLGPVLFRHGRIDDDAGSGAVIPAQ